MQPQEVEEVEIVEELRAEVNLLIYPLFALTTKDVTKREETEFKAAINREDKRFEVVWNVSGHQKYGYPGPFGKKVHRAIEQIIEEESFPVENPVTFSIYGLCKRMDINPGGRQYDQIRKALKRIQFASIESKEAFYHKGRKKWVTKTFSLYDSIVFKGEELSTGEVAERTNLYLNNLYLESINSRYIKPLNYSYYRKLSTNIAQRLYELLGVKFYGIYGSSQPYIRYKYSTLCQLLPVKRMQYLSSAKRRLHRAHDELSNTSFLKAIRWREVEGEKDWYIYYTPGKRAEDEIEEFGNLSYFTTNSNKPILTEDQERSVGVWISELSRKLEDENGENEGYYKKLAKLIVKDQLPENLLRQCLSEVKSEDQMRQRDPEADPIRNRSAYFTDLLKRRLKERDKDLNELLKGV